MTRFVSLSLVVALTISLSNLYGADLHLTSGKVIRAKISAVTKESVSITKPPKNTEDSIAANEIASIVWDSEPTGMNLYRGHEKKGYFKQALEGYQKAASEVTETQGQNVQGDLDFLVARTKSKLSISDPKMLDEAIEGFKAYQSTHANHYRYYESYRLLGNLYMKKNSIPEAEAAFEKLAEAPWQDFKLAAQINQAHLKLAQDKIDEALTSLEAAVSETTQSLKTTKTKITAVDMKIKNIDDKKQLDDKAKKEKTAALKEKKSLEELERQLKSRQFEALLGKVNCLVKKKSYGDGLKVLQEVAKDIPDEETSLQAEIYLRQGDCHQADGSVKPAILAYLHVDVLYFKEAEKHAEALYQLSKLWPLVDKPDRAKEAAVRLKQSYGNSHWASLVEGAKEGQK